MLRSRSRKAFAILGTIGAGSVYYLNTPSSPPIPSSRPEKSRRPPPPWTPPSRQTMISSLKSTPQFDLLIIGGGATGAGVALDAAARGLNVALVERDDFSSGTSSKSTKLVHGGVRYLQKAVMELDYDQYKLVREALHERKIFLQTAPYLSHSLPIMLPLYKYWQLPYYWAGCKMYDLLAGSENMESSYLMSKGKALDAFPMLKGDGLVGAMVYYDGQHNDARMNVALIMTAVQHGATVVNYADVTSLAKDSNGKLSGATVKDVLSGETIHVKAKGVINATGPFSDGVLQMASDSPENHKPIVQASSGVHITLPNYYSPRSLGLIDPETSDGRVIFFLPWQGNTIAGTTDTASPVEKDPIPKEEEIQWILEEIRTYLSPDIKVRRGDVLSAWSGLRPLVRDPNSTKSGTQGLVRSHLINVTDQGLVTIAGGKWTTYRAMAAETVDRAIQEFGLQEHLKGDGKCFTEQVRLVGSDGWTPNMFISLIQRFGLDTEVAKHLSMNYGDRAWTVCSYLRPTNQRWPQYGLRITPQYPFIEAEIRYAVHHEYAQTAIDFLSRRSRLSFLNAQAAHEVLPRVIDVMSEELGWSSQRRHEEYARAANQLKSMGLPPQPPKQLDSWSRWLLKHFFLTSDERTALNDVQGVGSVAQSRAILTPTQRDNYLSRFKARIEKDRGLAITEIGELVRDISGFERIKDSQIAYVMSQAGLGGKIEVSSDDFAEICAGLQDMIIAPTYTRLDAAQRRRIPVEKSGGGV